MLFLPDRHLGFEGVDQVCARGQRLTTVDCPDCHDYGNVADLEVAHAMLHRDREHIVLISGLLSTLGQHVNCAGMLGVVE